MRRSLQLGLVLRWCPRPRARWRMQVLRLLQFTCFAGTNCTNTDAAGACAVIRVLNSLGLDAAKYEQVLSLLALLVQKHEYRRCQV